MAASAYNILMSLQNTATELTGIECLWARATPHINSEDVILQEYTLSDVGLECPKPIKVIASNSDYNPGNFSVDLFGINYDAPFEINIPLQVWSNVFGTDTMPQKGDIVYVKLVHKLFEVQTSQIIHTVGERPTYYKCQLGKYNQIASRNESEELRASIDDFTVGQQELFGDVISQEVADIVVETETAYNTTTYVDPIKDFDLKSIVNERVFGSEGNIISVAHYDFTTATCNNTYKMDAMYSASEERNHWIYTCWFKTNGTNVVEGRVIKLSLITKDKQFWYFNISSNIKLEDGDEVTLFRGNILKLNGVMVQFPCEDKAVLRITASEASKASKKITNWWTSGTFKVQKVNTLNLICGYDDMDMPYRIDINDYTVKLRLGGVDKQIHTSLDTQWWNYMAVDMGPLSTHIIIKQIHVFGEEHPKCLDVCDETIEHAPQDFNITDFAVEGKDTNLCISNIRLYESEYDMGDTWKSDMYSNTTRNASRLILVDYPNSANGSAFQTVVR